MCDNEADKYKEILSAYYIKGAEKTLSMSEKKEKARDCCVSMYGYGKNLLHSTYERACVANETTISQTK